MKINRRNRIAHEILSTERTYKVGLDTLVNDFNVIFNLFSFYLFIIYFIYYFILFFLIFF